MLRINTVFDKFSQNIWRSAFVMHNKISHLVTWLSQWVNKIYSFLFEQHFFRTNGTNTSTRMDWVRNEIGNLSKNQFSIHMHNEYFRIRTRTVQSERLKKFICTGGEFSLLCCMVLLMLLNCNKISHHSWAEKLKTIVVFRVSSACSMCGKSFIIAWWIMIIESSRFEYSILATHLMSVVL